MAKPNDEKEEPIDDTGEDEEEIDEESNDEESEKVGVR